MPLRDMTTLSTTAAPDENITIQFGLNNTVEKHNRLIGNIEMNDHIVVTTILLGLFGLIGFIGNLFVIIVFGFKRKRTTNRIFVVGLAVTDILVCATTIPSEMLEINKHYFYEISGVCKVSYFLTYSFVISSALLLVPLSIDRYNRICKTFQMQWTPKGAFKRVCIIYSVAVLFSLPNLGFRGLQTFTTSLNITKQYCLFDELLVNTWIPLIYNSVIFMIPITLIIILIVIFVLIGREIFAQHRFRTQFQMSNVSVIYSTDSSRENKYCPKEKASCIITKVAFVIVVIFFVSYIPTSGLKLYEAVHGIEPYNPSNTGVMLATRFAYLLNHVMNPLAYIVLDKRFGQAICSLFCCYKRDYDTYSNNISA